MKTEFLQNNALKMLEPGNHSRIRWLFCPRPSQRKGNTYPPAEVLYNRLFPDARVYLPMQELDEFNNLLWYNHL